jgi:hypothetical protein
LLPISFGADLHGTTELAFTPPGAPQIASVRPVLPGAYIPSLLIQIGPLTTLFGWSNIRFGTASGEGHARSVRKCRDRDVSQLLCPSSHFIGASRTNIHTWPPVFAC